VETDLKYGRFLAGCGVYSDEASTLIRSIIASQVDATADQRGYFVTPQIQAGSVRSYWQRLVAIFKKLENSTDRIIVKYRTTVYPARRDDGRISSYGATWSDTDTFVVASADFANVVAGDEIEIFVGKGAGSLAHVLSITGTSPNYTVNLDEAIPNVSGVSYIMVSRWTKLGTISSQTIQKKIWSIAKMSTWIQFKVELRGTESSPELEKLNLFLTEAGLM
jgi:hypothetical protein